MPLFQKSVVSKYLQQLDQAELKNAYDKFKSFYGDKERIENIRLLKEENYQEGFLREIFVQVLGYTINPDKNYNLTTEFKNETDSKKADGAILENDKAIGVIELKSTKTPDLESIKEQAFSYKNNHSNCRYVITSNFEKLRLYIDNATEWEEFNLFELDFERFNILYLFLCKESLFSGVTSNLKKESILHEEDVTDKLYNDYSKFKKDIFENLVKNNPGRDKLLLFHKSQKLLDRMLFVLFAEDCGLLPPNAISKIIEQWKAFKKLDEPVSLYSRFLKLFKHLDEGHKYESYEIPSYNGGLFRKDELLEELIIDDNILEVHSLKLSNYNFSTEVDVNILGHIFEHSISEIEQVAAEIEGTESDKERSRRKKEGIFYTPKYITKYIVENTVGTLCYEKKKELNINFIENEIIENARTAKGKLTQKAKELLTRLDKYRAYLLSLKILDPACGSGAFLNQALEFLINEHEMLDGYRKEIEDSLGLLDIKKSILENNLYGVDINEEAVEIAKLSLWLRTAEKGRKLSDLNNNIKCGNSLIDNPEVAGDKAFDWEKEFPEIMTAGGFDVVIGNPPYVRVEYINETQLKYYKKYYASATSKFDLSSLFVEKSILLLKEFGLYSIISSYQFIYASSGLGLRKFLIGNASSQVIKFSSDSQIFKGATTYTAIFIFNKRLNNKFTICEAKCNEDKINIENSYEIQKENLIAAKTIISDTKIYDKILANRSIIKGREIGYAKTGVVTSADDIFYINTETIELNKLEKEIIYPIVGPDELYRWYIEPTKTYCIYPYSYIDNKTELLSILAIKAKYPNIYSYLKKHEGILKSRSQGRKDYSESERWYQLNRPREKWIYDSVKIIYPGTTNSPKFAIDNVKQLFRNARTYSFILKDISLTHYKYLLCLLNSKLCYYFISIKCPPKNNGYFELSTSFLDEFPFIKYNKEQGKDLIDKAELQISYTKNKLNKISLFLSRITTNFPIEKLSNKLKEFYNYDFKTFLSELKKKKITLSLKQQEEWEEYFNEYKKEINSLHDTIAKTDNEIDQMVYQLYGLTEEEIKIVENSVKN